jgi:hypothetical protein
MGRRMYAAWEKIVGRLYSTLCDPRFDPKPGRLRYFELHWALRFLLHDCGTGYDMTAVTDILHANVSGHMREACCGARD